MRQLAQLSSLRITPKAKLGPLSQLCSLSHLGFCGFFSLHKNPHVPDSRCGQPWLGSQFSRLLQAALRFPLHPLARLASMLWAFLVVSLEVPLACRYGLGMYLSAGFFAQAVSPVQPDR